MRPAFSTIVLLLLATYITGQNVKVTHVSDGDSFIIAGGQRVRMIGVDAPELADNFGRESKEHLAKLIRGKAVTLERDPLNSDRDIHGRMLRFVAVNGTDVNQQMIADGYAQALLRYRFAREREKAYREAEAAAKSGRRGIWALTTIGITPAEVPAESRPGTEPSRSWPQLCSGAIVLLFVIILRVSRPQRKRQSSDDLRRNGEG